MTYILLRKAEFEALDGDTREAMIADGVEVRLIDADESDTVTEHKPDVAISQPEGGAGDVGLSVLSNQVVTLIAQNARLVEAVERMETQLPKILASLGDRITGGSAVVQTPEPLPVTLFDVVMAETGQVIYRQTGVGAAETKPMPSPERGNPKAK